MIAIMVVISLYMVWKLPVIKTDTQQPKSTPATVAMASAV
jgi:hypothetical protein